MQSGLAGVLGGIIGATAAVLLLRSGLGGEQVGRFQVAAYPNVGVVRLNTATGEIRGCLAGPKLLPAVSCELSVEGLWQAERTGGLPPTHLTLGDGAK